MSGAASEPGLSGFGVWESHFTVISSMWLSVSLDVVSCFIFSTVSLAICFSKGLYRYPDRSTEFDRL